MGRGPCEELDEYNRVVVLLNMSGVGRRKKHLRICGFRKGVGKTDPCGFIIQEWGDGGEGFRAPELEKEDSMSQPRKIAEEYSSPTVKTLIPFSASYKILLSEICLTTNPVFAFSFTVNTFRKAGILAEAILACQDGPPVVRRVRVLIFNRREALYL